MNLVDKLSLYREAMAFYELAECGRENIPEKKNVESYIPYIVNMSFCAELYLKLLLIDNGKTITNVRKLGHNLYKLYDSLTIEQKELIYNSFKRPLIYSIEDELQLINTAFQDWRYLVLNRENQDGRRFQFKPFFIKEFNEVLSHICKEIFEN